MKNRNFQKRLNFALQGLRVAWRSEKSLRTQVWIGSAAVLFLLILQPALFWWAIVALTIALVLAAELFNTALEHLADHLHPDEHPRIKIVKDCAAAGVLVLSLSAVVIGLLALFSVL